MLGMSASIYTCVCIYMYIYIHTHIPEQVYVVLSEMTCHMKVWPNVTQPML